MTAPNLQELTITELVDRFAHDALAQDKALLYDEIDEFNDLMDEMNAISKELEKEKESRRGYDFSASIIMQTYKYGYRQRERHCPWRQSPLGNEIEAIANSRHFPQAGDAGMTLWFLDRKSES